MSRELLLSSGSSVTIQSSVSPQTTSNYPVENILGEDLITSWQYYQDESILNFPIWAIIDLGADGIVTEIEVHGRSLLWGGDSCPRHFQLSISPDFGRSPDHADFTIIQSSIVGSPTRAGRDWTNSTSIAIAPQFVRYVKISIDSTWARNSVWMGLSAVRVYGQYTISTSIISNAEIDALSTPPIYSNSYVDYNRVILNAPTITSNTTLVWASGPIGPSVTTAALWAPGYITYMMDMYSYGEVVAIGTRMVSNSHIAGIDTKTILSNTSIRRTATSVTATYVAFAGSGSIGSLRADGNNYDPTVFEMRARTYSLLLSTSDGVIVDDTFTSQVIDMKTVEPPFGYQNYDWSYDWVTRTFNAAAYLVETRTGETIDELNAAIFTIKNMGYRFERGSIPRYHQYRFHVWASGSGDFEFHQFTIRGHVMHGVNKYYKALISDPFLTTNVVNFDIPRIWEPTLTNVNLWTGSYIPGDINNDGKVDGADWQYLFNYSFVQPPGPAPPVLAAADVNGDGFVDIEDFAYLLNYISGSGPPPRVPIPNLPSYTFGLPTLSQTIGHWKFTEDPTIGTGYLLDVSSPRYNLTGYQLGDSHHVSGYAELANISSAIHFDLTDAHAYIPSTDATMFDMQFDSFTVEIIFKLPAAPLTHMKIIDKGTWRPAKGWYLEFKSTGTIQMHIGDDGQAGVYIGSLTRIDDGAWHYVVVTHYRAYNIGKLYIDGVLDNTVNTNDVYGSIEYPTRQLSIGKYPVDVFVDEICITNFGSGVGQRVLTADEISSRWAAIQKN